MCPNFILLALLVWEEFAKNHHEELNDTLLYIVETKTSVFSANAQSRVAAVVPDGVVVSLHVWHQCTRRVKGPQRAPFRLKKAV